jgi:hypothetical protein
MAVIVILLQSAVPALERVGVKGNELMLRMAHLGENSSKCAVLALEA